MGKIYSKGNDRFLSVGNEELSLFENKKTESIFVDPILPKNFEKKNSITTKLKPDSKSGFSKIIKSISKIKNTAFIIHGTDDRKPVLETFYPYNVICYLSIKAHDGQTFPATGFFISKRCVITAGHCVFERKNWVSSAEVTPALLGQLAPYGSATGKRFRSVTGWINNKDSNFDYGAIILDDNALFNKIQSTLGFKVLSDETLIEVAGYPKNKGKSPWYATGDILRRSKYKVFYEVDTEAGNSGSPIITVVNGKKYTIGLHTDGAYPNSGIYLRQEMLDRWSEWSKL
jgi:glutamyl endopeptidase